MIKVLFVCHGNICRSPMAEFIFKDYVNKKGKTNEFLIDSCATSSEEIGNSIHHGTRMILDKYDVDYSKKRARKITKDDYYRYDYIIAMDHYNLINLRPYIFGDPERKVHLLLEFADVNRDISDPWYTGNFIETENDILLGIKAFYDYLKNKKK
ncbi:MAG: low molecular weight protein-tyrosine-phosphatase [Anaeroplasma sp.]